MKETICPVCGKHILSEPFDICPECGWEFDRVQQENPDYAGGANSKSLNEAIKSYKNSEKCIYIVRHGQTDWNKLRRIQGRTDIPLNNEGRRQAELIAESLSEVSFDLVYSSPLRRAISTAEIIAPQGKVMIDERLTERSFGTLEGEKIPSDEEFRRLCSMDSGFGIESYDNLKNRAMDFLKVLKRRHKGKNILIVTHGGICVALREYFEGPPEDGNYAALIPQNGEILKYSNK